jgi:hypothetical protein
MIPSALQAAVQQAVRVLSNMVAALNDDIKRRLLDEDLPGKVSLFKGPEQVWTDIAEKSDWKGTEFGSHHFTGKSLHLAN